MKKLLVTAVVLAMVCLSSMAFAADVTVGGEVNVRSRNFNNFDLNSNAGDHAVFTQERVLLEVNVKADNNVKGKVAIWNDFDTWGRFETPQANATTGNASSPKGGQNSPATTASNGRIAIREAWLDFMIPDMPIGIKAGHQLLELGNGWFLTSKYAGSDAWIVYFPMGRNTLSFANIKISEGPGTNAAGEASNTGVRTSSDDVDAYALIGSFKLSDAMTAGFDVSYIRDPSSFLVSSGTGTGFKLTNIGLNFNGKVGPAKLAVELDIQDGKADGTTQVKYKGNQIVAQASIPVDPITINATLARGSGNKANSTDKKDGILTLLDARQHYTLIYEYSGKLRTAAGVTQTGFQNTTAISAGVKAKASKSLTVGGELWYFMATEKTNVNATGGAATGELSNDVGTEIDLTANWAISPNVSWNWTAAYFAPGKVYKQADGTGKDAATAVQGYLALKF